MKRFYLSLALVLTGVLTSQGADWTRFRGENGFGVANDTNIPTTITAENILWKTLIPGRGGSSPIISNGKIFVQTSSSEGDKRELICIDEKTGKTEWVKELKGAFAKTHAKNSLASSTPATDGKHVFTVFWDGKTISLTAWDFSGKLLWTKNLGKFDSQHGPGLSPMIHEDRVILNIDQDGLAEVVAYDVKNGKEVWKKSREAHRACYTTPFLTKGADGKEQLIVASTAGVSAYQPKDGTIIWNWAWKFTAKMPLRNVGGPVLHNGMIFAVSGDGGGDRHMVALKPDDKGGEPSLAWEKKKGTPYVPMMLAKGDYLFWVTDKENVAVCVEAKTGKEIWQERLGGGGQVFASPVLINDAIYSVNEKGTIFVFAASNKYKFISKYDLKEDVIASLSVANGRLYVRSDNSLICIGKK